MDHLRGHLLLFDSGPAPASALAGTRFLVAAGVIEIARLAAVGWLRPALPLGALVPALLALALLVSARLCGGKLTPLGLRRWRAWSTTERSYFVQVLVLASVLFPVLLVAPRLARVTPAGLAQVFVPYLFYGFYQELVYRGLVQLALVRRFGPVAGVVAANVLYTFGPLHWSYFQAPLSTAGPMFAAISAIGLFFGILYHRSGNLWIVAVFHAVGNAVIVYAASL